MSHCVVATVLCCTLYRRLQDHFLGKQHIGYQVRGHCTVLLHTILSLNYSILALYSLHCHYIIVFVQYYTIPALLLLREVVTTIVYCNRLTLSTAAVHARHCGGHSKTPRN